jgi:glucose-1-phosphate thymidylyltransferase
VALVLVDNVYGQHFSTNLLAAAKVQKGATVFGYHVTDPQRFGVVEFDQTGKVLSVEENLISQNHIMRLRVLFL